MSQYYDPVTDYELYDSLILAGVQSPGVCKVSMTSRDLGWSNASAPGSDGAESTLTGAKLAEFEVEFLLWQGDSEVSHFMLWPGFRAVLQTPVSKGDPKALDIFHPQLTELGITSVVVQSWTEPTPNGDGSATAKVKFIEYSAGTKDRPGNGKMNGSKATTPGGGGKKPGEIQGITEEEDKNKALREELEALNEEYSSL